MDQKAFDAMMAGIKPAAGEAAGQDETPTLELDTEALQSVAQTVLDGSVASTGEDGESGGGASWPPQALQDQAATMAQDLKDNGLSTLDDPVEAFAGGVAESVFETKDFLFGDTPPEDQSRFRKDVHDKTTGLKQENLLNGFSAGIGQFAGAMVGIGKAQAVAKSLPWVGKGISAVLGWSRGVTESANAAAAGAIAFDPHEERLSNLVQGTPLANPLTAWLAADPDDSSAEGRLKSAIESIGLDAAIAGTFMGAAKIYKALRKGDTEAASKAVDELEKTQQKDMEADNGVSTSDLPEGSAAGGDDVSRNQLPRDGSGTEANGGIRAAGEEVPEGGARPEADSALPVEVVSNPTSVAQSLDTKLPPRGQPRVNLEVDEAADILKQADGDLEAIQKYGNWYKAMEEGHDFGKGVGINYRALNTDADMDDLMARMVDAIDEQRGTIKGGKVVTDEAANKRLRDYAILFGEDPAAVLGAVQQAGRMGADLTARMEAGFILAERTLRDTWRLHQLYKAGDASGFGGPAAMRQEIAKRMSMSASMFAHADSLKSNYARGMRRMQFFNDYSALKDLDMDKAFDLLDATGGDPSKFKKLANPSIWSQIGDYALYLRVNNMVSGPVTQLINVSTNSYMLGVRPLERMLGAVIPAVRGVPESRKVLREAMAQYAYMGNAFTDGFFTAGKAFMRNDSVLAPHRTELYGGNQAVSTSGMVGTQPLNSQFFKPWDNPSNVLYNALSVATVPIGMPTRLLGAVDEVVKQTTYRSMLMARAHVEATGLAVDAGLSGKAAKDFVRAHVTKRLDEGFDQAGRGTDPTALHEAQVATFQQDLLPGTVGKWVQSGTSNIKALRLVLPFVKTPTNVIRYGWKMTPGLNLLQGEYRDMLMGKIGATAMERQQMKAQAIGQMTMGSLFMGSVAYMAANGMITGGGPTDPKLRQELMATGWRPYSFVWEADDETKRYVQFGRFDPVAVPMGIIADLQDYLHALDSEEEPPEVSAIIGGLGIALAKQFTNKSYLLGATQTMEALMDPDRKWESVGGSMATSFIPYSAAMRQLNPDEYLRDAQTMTDRLRGAIPGLSEKVPARYDAFGEKVLARPGLWSSTDDAILDTEMQRLALESGAAPVRVSPNMKGVDLREVTMSNGKNAYEEYQRLSGKPGTRTKPLKAVITKFIQSERYRKAPDGGADVRGTKLWLLHSLTSKYRTAAGNVLRKDPAVREALMAETVKVRSHYKQPTGSQTQQQAGPIDKLLGAFGLTK